MSLSNRAKTRRTFVALTQKQECRCTQLCAQFPISRSTGYRWLARYRANGLLALSDSSKRPRNSPKQTPDRIRTEILKLRRKHTAWGALRIRRALELQDGDSAPSESTINRILTKGRNELSIVRLFIVVATLARAWIFRRLATAATKNQTVISRTMLTNK